MGLFKTIGQIMGDVAQVVVAPIEVAADATRGLTKEAANMSKEMVKDLKREFNPDETEEPSDGE